MATPALGILPRSGASPTDVQVAALASPNCGPRRDGLTPRFVVIHHTAMASAEVAIERLCDPATEVSAHYVICKAGAVTRLVPENLRAWHAGAGEWMGLQDLNSRSIGIELDNNGQLPFSEPLMAALLELLPGILSRWDIPPENVIGHSDMAPGRKVDPGPHFDWPRLAALNLAERHIPHPTLGFDSNTFRTLARAVGYTAPVDDQTLLDAVRLRWRPFASGRLTREDVLALPDRP